MRTHFSQVEKLNAILEKKEKKMASISRLAWGAQVVMQHMNKPDDERIKFLSAEVERLCLELADKDQMLQDVKLQHAITSLDSLAAHVGTELPSQTLRARTAARATKVRGSLGMPGMPEEPTTVEVVDEEASEAEEAPTATAEVGTVEDLTLHSQEWQALFMRKQREIESFRKAWMSEIAEIGGFIEHLHDEGHEKVSFDEFIMMQKAAQGIPVVSDDADEERELLEALEAGVDYVLSMGRPPPPPEEIESMLKTIESLEQQVAE